MTIIVVDDDVRDELLRISAELQLKLGRRVGYNDVVRYLIEIRAKRPELLDGAVVKVRDAGLIWELREERRRDEEKLERLLCPGRVGAQTSSGSQVGRCRRP